MEYNLMPGALTIDLVDGSVHGDLDHCPKEDLLESARALLSLLPRVRHKGLWGLGKAYDADCYLYTRDKRYKLPDGLTLATTDPPPGAKWRHSPRPFSLIVQDSDREEHWRRYTYSKLIGSVREGQVSEDITGLSSHHIPRPAPTVPTPKGRPKGGVKPAPSVERPRMF
jgi:hypothetical protein